MSYVLAGYGATVGVLAVYGLRVMLRVRALARAPRTPR
jgi:hypothetical protein